MEPSPANLEAAVARVRTGSADARLWIDEVRETAVGVANQADSLIDASRRASLMARRLEAGAGRNNCVGVFGPSQAGKSYLVSALARPSGERMAVVLGDEVKDFLRDVNPPGDRESTGLVSRFTSRRGAADPAHPVELRLLSETDIVKVLANSYFLDFDPNNTRIPPPEEDDVRAAVAAAEAAAGGTAARHLDEIALYDLGQYFQRNFQARIGALNHAGYWDAVIRVGGRLALADRARFFALTWGRIGAFTELYLHLMESLDQLGHAPEARAASRAVLPRITEGGEPNSIIDVGVLARLRTPADAADLVSVRPVADGSATAAIELPRATLTALVAEIRLTLSTPPWPFFEHTDLLDFPGARSRLKLVDMPSSDDGAAARLRELFLRGKIAYLFQRYTDELELTSMLLCMPPSVAEVKDLAPMVRGWIHQTHGATAERRKVVRNALFLVLTKHDMEFQEKEGEGADSRRGKWDRRLQASLLELYGPDGWPDDWDGAPFANTLFLRNPGVKQVHLMDYADVESLDEVGPAVAAARLIGDYETAFLDSDVVARHVTRKEAVWNAALMPNDGGVAFLVERLGEVLEPGLKSRQAAERLGEVAAGLASALNGFHHAEGDLARQEKDAAMQALRRSLHQTLSRAPIGGLGPLMVAMMLRADDVRAVFAGVAALRPSELEGAGGVGGPAVAGDPWGDDPWAEPAAATPAEPRPTGRPERSDLFAVRIMNLWAAQLRALQQDPSALATIGIDAADLGRLVDELLIAADRAGLAERIAEEARRETVSASARWADVTDRVARAARFAVNDFVAYLGFGDLPAAERPGIPEPPRSSERAIFGPGSLGAPGQELGDAPEVLERAFFVDWGVALRSMGVANVGHAAGREITDEQNRRLGAILDRVDLQRASD
ncbi:MAG: virulence factor SrfC family protein [Pseudomonadota bacterium]